MPQTPDILNTFTGIDSNATRFLIVLLIDTSTSMINPASPDAKESKIFAVRKGLEKYLNDTKKLKIGRRQMDICVITYGGLKPEVVQDFNIPDNIDIQVLLDKIVPNGQTPMASGLKLALNMIKKRVSVLNGQGIETTKPRLIVMGDGESTEDITEVAKEIHKMYKQRELKGRCIGVGEDCETSDLAAISPNGKVEKVDTLGIANVFELLSQKTLKLSVSSPTVDVDNDDPNF